MLVLVLAKASNRHIKTTLCGGHGELQLTFARQHVACKSTQTWHSLHDLRCNHRTFFNVHETIGLRGVIAKQNFVSCLNRRKHSTATAALVADNNILNRALDTAGGKGINHLLSLEIFVGSLIHMLQRTATTCAVMLTHRCNTMRTRLDNFFQFRTWSLHLGAHKLAFKGIGNKDLSGFALSNAIPFVGKAGDTKGFYSGFRLLRHGTAFTALQGHMQCLIS